MALLSGSPATNAGDPAYNGPLTTDQRGTGFSRVQGGRLDIGAYEVQNAAPKADDQDVTTDEDTASSITLTASDADGNTLTYTVVDSPPHGLLSGTAPNLTYTPA